MMDSHYFKDILKLPWHPKSVHQQLQTQFGANHAFQDVIFVFTEMQI